MSVEEVRSNGGELFKFIIDIVRNSALPTEALYQIILASTMVKKSRGFILPAVQKGLPGHVSGLAGEFDLRCHASGGK